MAKIKTGFARVCITPPLGTPVWGYYEERFTKGVLDDLYATAVAFDDGKNKAVIISAELLHLTTKHSNIVRKVISDFCNIPVEAIFIACTHTHTGPLVEIGAENESDYDRFLINQLRDAAYYALGDLRDTEFSINVGEAKNLSFVRRYRMKDGSVQTNPGVGNPNIKEMLGKPTEKVNLVKLERDGGDDIFVVSFGTHPDTVGGELISADWPGFVRSTIEKALDGVKCLFLNGVQGDVNHINPNPTEGEKKGTFIDFDSVPRGYDHAKYMGRAIAGAVLQICDKTEPVNVGDIKFAGGDIKIASNQENDRLEEAERIYKLHNEGKDEEIPFTEMELTTVVAEATRIVRLKDGPEFYDFTLSAISMGDIAFTGFPGEPFVELGRRIEDASPFKMTFTCCLVNGGDSYFPTSAAFDEGGYEARSSYLKRGADDVLVNGALDLLNKVK